MTRDGVQRLTVRPALFSEADAIARLNNHFADQHLMLRRTPDMIGLGIADYLVAVDARGHVLACGALKERRRTLDWLAALESAPLADHDEVLALIDGHHLMATGLGWLDAHLLASTLLAGGRLWTLDAPLARAATQLSVLFHP